MSTTSRSLDITKHSVKAQLIAKTFENRIIGQPEAVSAYINVLEKYLSGMYSRTRPLANLLFLGPTGTGKTSSAEAFAYGLFGDESKMLKVNCGEFQHSHETAKLVGSPPGYLGHRETHPMLTNARLKDLRSEAFPFSILLFDEIEKASDALWNLLLSILDKGSLSTGTNEQVDELRNCVIILTSNVGSKELASRLGGDAIGFSSGESALSAERLKEISVSAAQRKFMPEFLNRVDEIIMFNSLTEKDLEEIIELELNKIQAQVIASASTKVNVCVSPSAKKAIVAEGYDKKYNARHLKRAIENRVALAVSCAIVTEQALDLDSVVVDHKDGEFVYSVEYNLSPRKPA